MSLHKKGSRNIGNFRSFTRFFPPKLIVMLCQISPGFTGCSEYFPTNIGDEVQHGFFNVKNIAMEETNVCVKRTFELTSLNDKDKPERLIQHFQFLNWPNYGIPDAVGPIANFIKLVHENGMNDPEFVIHCSGGIGRSGTFLTAYGVYSHYLKLLQIDDICPPITQPLNLIETVKSFRHQRHPWMVEGLRQYEMAYDISLYLLNEITK